jgi:hypothetical protein
MGGNGGLPRHLRPPGGIHEDDDEILPVEMARRRGTKTRRPVRGSVRSAAEGWVGGEQLQEEVGLDRLDEVVIDAFIAR